MFARTDLQFRGVLVTLLCLAVVGCRSPAGPRADGGIAERSPSSARTVAGKEPPLRPVDGGGRSDDIAAIFFVHSGSLIPLVCLEGQKRDPLSRDECIQRLPEAIDVVASDGRRLRAKGRGRVACEASGSQTPTLPLMDPTMQEGFAALRVGDASPPRWLVPRPQAARADDTLRRRIRERISKVAREAAGKPLTVDPPVCLGIGPEGAEECFASARVTGGGPGYAFSGLLLVRGGRAPGVTVLKQSELETFSVIDAVDLYGDGRFAVAVSTSYYEGGGALIGAVDGDDFWVMGSWGCGG